MEEYPWLRRVVGWIWFGVWSVVLYLVASPWRDLGGIVDERLRWFHRFGLCMGLASGAVAGMYLREIGAGKGGVRRKRWYRVAWYIMAGPTVVMMIALAMSHGRQGEIGILLTGFLASWAGFDFGWAIYPLLHGRSPDGDEQAAQERISM